MWGGGLFHPWPISHQIQSKSVLIKVKCSLLVPTRITNPTRIPDILPTTKNSVVVVVDCNPNEKLAEETHIENPERL